MNIHTYTIVYDVLDGEIGDVWNTRHIGTLLF